MVSNEELKYENLYGLLTTFKNYFSIIVQVQKNDQITANSCKPRDMLFEINMNSHITIFQLLPNYST